MALKHKRKSNMKPLLWGRIAVCSLSLSEETGQKLGLQNPFCRYLCLIWALEQLFSPNLHHVVGWGCLGNYATIAQPVKMSVWESKLFILQFYNL